MANDKRVKRPTFTTPVVTFKYPKLNEVDFGTDKFPKPNGEYNVRGIAVATDPAVRALIAKIEPLMREAQAEAEAKYAELKVDVKKKLIAKNGKSGITENAFFHPIYDEETEAETGEIEFRFKMTASGVRKRDDKPWSRKPGLFDAGRNPLPKTVSIWGGTKGKVSFTAEPYWVAGQGAYGVSLRLEAVQVIDLVSAGQRSASSYGFEDEDGFTAGPDETTDDTTTEATDGSTEAADDGNF